MERIFEKLEQNDFHQPKYKVFAEKPVYIRRTKSFKQGYLKNGKSVSTSNNEGIVSKKLYTLTGEKLSLARMPEKWIKTDVYIRQKNEAISDGRV